MFWFWGTILLSMVILLTFRRRYFIVGYVVTAFVGFTAEVLIEP